MPCIILHLAVYRRICQVYTDIYAIKTCTVYVYILYINVSYELYTVITQFSHITRYRQIWKTGALVANVATSTNLCHTSTSPRIPQGLFAPRSQTLFWRKVPNKMYRFSYDFLSPDIPIPNWQLVFWDLVICHPNFHAFWCLRFVTTGDDTKSGSPEPPPETN